MTFSGEPDPQPVDWDRLNRLRGVGAIEPAEHETGSTAQGVTRWRKRPVTVEAIQWTGANAIEVAAFTGSKFDVVDPEDRGDDPDITAQVFDVLHSTWVGLHTGHWVIRGVRGEFYPCDDGVLAETYEPADGDQVTVGREDLRMAAAVADRMNVADSDGVHAQMTAPRWPSSTGSPLLRR